MHAVYMFGLQLRAARSMTVGDAATIVNRRPENEIDDDAEVSIPLSAANTLEWISFPFRRSKIALFRDL